MRARGVQVMMAVVLVMQAGVLRAEPPSGSIGSAHPIAVQAFAPDGRWVVACQAREDTNKDGEVSVMVGHHGDMWGDRLRPYLILGAGEGEAIDAFVAADPTGRFVSVIRGGHLELVDTRSEHVITLEGASTEDDPNPFGGHRAASFDAEGTKMLYLKPAEGGEGEVVMVRDLTTGDTRAVDPGEGLLWRAHISSDGASIVAAVVTEDSNGDGTLEGPRVQTSLSGRQCRGPIASYSTGRNRGDTPVYRIINLADTAVVEEAPADTKLDEALRDASVGGYFRRAPRTEGGLTLRAEGDGGGIPTGPMRWE